MGASRRSNWCRKRVGHGAKDGGGGRDDFGTDAVAGEQENRCVHVGIRFGIRDLGIRDSAIRDSRISGFADFGIRSYTPCP